MSLFIKMKARPRGAVLPAHSAGRQLPGAYVVDGKLFFRLLDNSTISCDCIGEPFASMVVALFKSAK